LRLWEVYVHFCLVHSRVSMLGLALLLYCTRYLWRPFAFIDLSGHASKKFRSFERSHGPAGRIHGILKAFASILYN
jgi:hypothetical protein